MSIFVCAFAVNCLQAEVTITPISNIAEIANALETAEEDTLVVFDVDRTLVIMGDQALKGGKSGLKKRLRTYPAYQELSLEEQQNLMSIVILKANHTIIENESLNLIRELQNRNIKTIFCTTLETGSFGIIPDMVQWRIDSLKHLGLDFSPSFAEIPEIVFFPGENNTPVFKDGALISGKRDKGEMLRLFFERINWTPKKIVMIDDLPLQIESVRKEFENSSIEVTCFLYNYIVEFLKDQVVDETLVDFQLQSLIYNHVWYTDEEARAKL